MLTLMNLEFIHNFLKISNKSITLSSHIAPFMCQMDIRIEVIETVVLFKS